MSSIEASLENLDQQLQILQSAIVKKKNKMNGLQQDLFESNKSVAAASNNNEAGAFVLPKEKVELLTQSLDRTIANLQALLVEEKTGEQSNG